MTTATFTADINNFVSQHINKEQNSIEVEGQMASVLIERELDRNIAEARQEYKEGKGVILNEEYISKFTAELAKE